MSRVLSTLIILLIPFASFSREADSLELILPAVHGQARVIVLNELSFQNRNSSQVQTLKFAREALALSRQIKYREGEAFALTNIGFANLNNSNYKSAISSFTTALIVFDSLQNHHGLSRVYNALGNTNNGMGDYQKALDYLLKSLKNEERLGDKTAIANTLNNIGSVYSSLDNPQKALEYHTSALQYAVQVQNKNLISISLTRMAILEYKFKKNLDKAILYLTRSYQLHKKQNDKRGLAFSLIHLAEIYRIQGKTNKALSYYKKAFEFEQEIGDKRGMAEALNTMGSMYMEMGKNKLASRKFREAIKHADEVGARPEIAQSFEYLSIASYNLSRFKAAIDYHRQFYKIKNELMNETSKKQIMEMQARFDLSSKEGRIEILEKEWTIQALEIDKQKQQVLLLSSTIILVVILAFAILAAYRVKHKGHTDLVEKTREIALQKEKTEGLYHELKEAHEHLSSSEAHLHQLNVTKDKFFSIIAHDLKNPFIGMMGLFDILLMEGSKIDEEEKNIYLKNLEGSVKQTYELLDNLLYWARSQTDGLHVNREQVDISKIVSENFRLLNANGQKKQIQMINNIPEYTFASADKFMISTVLRNLISNSIKFSHPGQQIEVCASERSSILEISVIDTGIGMSEERSRNLFSIDNSSSLGTSEERGTGLGLVVCKEFIEKNGGKIWVESKAGQGSTFRFTLEKANGNNVTLSYKNNPVPSGRQAS